MPRHHYPPASLRYFKARLRILTRPALWGTAIFLSVVGLVIREYWLHPDFLQNLQTNQVAADSQPTPANSSLTPEDIAIAADIDTSPALIKEIEQAGVLPIPSPSTEKTPAITQSKGLFDDLIAKKQAAAGDTKSNNSLGIVTPPAPVPTVENPFLVQAQSLLQANTVDSKDTFLGAKSFTPSASQPTTEETSSSLGIKLPNTTSQNQKVAPVSPLQAAINQSQSQNQQVNNSQIQTSTNSLGQLLPSTTLPSQTLPSTTGLSTATGYIQPGVTNSPQNSYTYSNGSQALPYAAPSAPVATPIVPATPSYNTSPYSIQAPSQGTVTPTTPVVPSTFGNSGVPQPTQLPQSNLSGFQQQPIQQLPQSNPVGVQQPNQVSQSNSSTSNPFPGTYVGGRRVNIFSNP